MNMESKVLRKILRLPRGEYYKTHLQIVNALLPIKLTTKEIEVLAAFMSLDGDIAKDRFGTSARKIIKKDLKLSDGGLGNYLKAFKEKGFVITQDELGDIVNPILSVQQDEQNYMVKLVNLEV